MEKRLPAGRKRLPIILVLCHRGRLHKSNVKIEFDIVFVTVNCRSCRNVGALPESKTRLQSVKKLLKFPIFGSADFQNMGFY